MESPRLETWRYRRAPARRSDRHQRRGSRERTPNRTDTPVRARAAAKSSSHRAQDRISISSSIHAAIQRQRERRRREQRREAGSDRARRILRRAGFLWPAAGGPFAPGGGQCSDERRAKRFRLGGKKSRAERERPVLQVQLGTLGHGTQVAELGSQLLRAVIERPGGLKD